MKKILYYTTILFNTIGTVMCIALVLTLGTKYDNFMPIIFISSLFFIISLSITILELNKSEKNNIIYLQRYQKPALSIASKGKIINYQEFFAKKKGDFIIA